MILDDYSNDPDTPLNYRLSPGQSFNLRQYFWQWYYMHENDRIVRLFGVITIRVKTIQPLFIILFGAP